MLIEKRRVAMIIAILIGIWFIGYTNTTQVKFTNAVCRTYNESWYLIHDCRLRAINRLKTVFNFNGTVLHPAFRVGVNLRLLKKANGYKPWLYNVSVNVCQFMNKPYNPVAIIFYGMLKKYTNFNHTCPYMGPQIVDGFHMQYEKFRVPWPGGEFLLEVDWLFDRKRQMSTNLYFMVEETS